MALWNERKRLSPSDMASGFSLLEMLVSVTVILIIMGAVFSYIDTVQKRFQGNSELVEATQSARAGMEVMTQEIGQAGYNSFPTSPTRYVSSAVVIAAGSAAATLNNVTGIYPGDWVAFDTGANYELVEVKAISTSAQTITATFQNAHTCTGTAPSCLALVYKMPYAAGILYGDVNSVATTSTDTSLEFFGDINSNGVINYVVYRLNPAPVNGAVFCIPAASPCPAANQYQIYNLYRSVKPVDFTLASRDTNNTAYTLVQNVLYNTTNKAGPSGMPIFCYNCSTGTTTNNPPSIVTNALTGAAVTYSVVTQVTVTISVAVSPQPLETGTREWYTMNSAISPINLVGALNIDNDYGRNQLPPVPPALPMSDPTPVYGQ